MASWRWLTKWIIKGCVGISWTRVRGRMGPPGRRDPRAKPPRLKEPAHFWPGGRGYGWMGLYKAHELHWPGVGRERQGLGWGTESSFGAMINPWKKNHSDLTPDLSLSKPLPAHTLLYEVCSLKALSVLLLSPIKPLLRHLFSTEDSVRWKRLPDQHFPNCPDEH